MSLECNHCSKELVYKCTTSTFWRLISEIKCLLSLCRTATQCSCCRLGVYFPSFCIWVYLNSLCETSQSMQHCCCLGKYSLLWAMQHNALPRQDKLPPTECECTHLARTYLNCRDCMHIQLLPGVSTGKETATNMQNIPETVNYMNTTYLNRKPSSLVPDDEQCNVRYWRTEGI